MYFYYRTRKNDSAIYNKMLQTGGGPPEDIPADPIEEMVRSVVPAINYEIDNKWDSIAIYKNEGKMKL